MVRVNPSPRRPGHPFTGIFHFAALAIILSIGALCLAYVMLSSQEERMHADSAAANRSSPSIRSSSSTSGKDISAAYMESRNDPYLIYGTAWKKGETARLVAEAIRSGFRFVDTACQPKHYDEAGVGEGWTTAAKELGLERKDVHLQTKFTSHDGQDPNNVPYDAGVPLEEQVRQSLKKSLQNLRTTYVDSLVLHSPMTTHGDTMRVWRTFESFVDDGTVRKLGISNCYDPDKFKRIYEEARVKPVALQNRFYEQSGFDAELRSFCIDHNVQYQTFWTLTANRRALSTLDIKVLAKSKGLTPQTLMYAFVLAIGGTPLSGTKSRDHMREDVALIERLQGGQKIFEDKDELGKMAAILGVSM